MNETNEWEALVANNKTEFDRIARKVLPDFRKYHDYSLQETLAINCFVTILKTGPDENHEEALLGLILTISQGDQDEPFWGNLNEFTPEGLRYLNSIVENYITKMREHSQDRHIEEWKNLMYTIYYSIDETMTFPNGVYVIDTYLSIIEFLEEYRYPPTRTPEDVSEYTWMLINSLISSILESLGHNPDDYLPGYYLPGA